MHYREAKGILSARNGMNLCRGCLHGCIYCDSRSRCYQIGHDFEDVEIKRNAAELLEQALARKRSKCVIGTGSMSDPYLPLPESLALTRRCLEIIDHYGFGAAILTKSAAILRDLDVLERIHSHSKCVVQMTLTTYDEALCRILEPRVSTTQKRFEALQVFQERGIPTVVWLGPILPWINDTEENLLGILGYCAESGVKGILCFGMGLTLRDGNREYFYAQLDRHFPGLKEKYQSTYGAGYEVSSPHHSALMNVFRQFCREHGILYRTEEVFAYLKEYEAHGEPAQLSLF